jgi:hypothetical protein
MTSSCGACGQLEIKREAQDMWNSLAEEVVFSGLSPCFSKSCTPDSDLP